MNKQKLLEDCRFLIQFFIDKSGGATFLISGQNDIPDFLVRGIIEAYTGKKNKYKDTVYRPFNSGSLGKLQLPAGHPASEHFSDPEDYAYGYPSILTEPDKYAFDSTFLDSIEGDDLITLERLMVREKASFEHFYAKWWDQASKQYPAMRYYWLPVDVLGEKSLNALLQHYPNREDMRNLTKQDLINISGIGETKADGLIKFFQKSEKFNDYDNDLEFFFSGGATSRSHSNELVDSNHVDRSVNGVQVEPSKLKSYVASQNGNQKQHTEDAEDISQQKQSSSLSNPIYWLIALGIVVWWKWDEILGYF